MSIRNVVHADGDQVRQLQLALADNLSSQGCILSASWRDIFERVPRHVFIPRFFLDREHNGHHESVEGDNPRQHEEWLSAIYSDDTLITQLDGTDDAWAPGGKPTSSSTMPSLMALMLEALDIRDGMSILEIGTGTGYNAALLCERLGPGNVTSVDIDPALVNAACRRLLSLRRIEVLPEATPSKFWLIGRDGSWAYQTTDTTGERIAVQGGRRRLWDELETVHAEWTALGQPPRNDFGLTVTRDGRHVLWHARPSAAKWELTSP